MSTKFGSWDGLAPISIHTALPLMALVASGVAIGLAISRIPDKFYSQKVDDGDTNGCKAIQLPDAFLSKTMASLPKLPERSPTEKDDDGHINENAISQLPDDLLCSILSRLCLIDAARTRILSRRWRNILPFRSALTFDCINMFGKTSFHCNRSPEKLFRFVTAVNQTLRLYSGRKIIRAKVSCCFAYRCASDFRRWMQTLVSLGVEELDVRFKCYAIPECGHFCLFNLFAFPFHLLFKAASLKHLQLFACALQPSFGGQFKSLETLKLSLVELNDGDMQNILSSCVNLRHLRMKRCLLPSELCISGPCLSLKLLMIDSCYTVTVIELEAVNLTTFGCYTNRSIKYIFSSVPKLEQISILYNGSGTMPCMLGEFGRDCPNLKTMLFQTKHKKLSYLPARANMFGKLMQLELLTKFDKCVDLLNIAPILAVCPVLEKLHLLARSPTHDIRRGTRWPVVCHVHLKEVEFLGFCGSGNQIEFASFLVRSTPALDLLMIQPFYIHYAGENECFKEEGTPVDPVERKSIHDELLKQAVSCTLDVVFG